MENLEEFGQELLREAVRVTKASNSLPEAGNEYEYYCSFKGFKKFNSKVGDRIKKLIHRLLLFEDINSSWINDNDDPDDLFDNIIEANDTLLEKVSSLLDEGTSSKVSNENASIPSHNIVGVASWNKKETALDVIGSINIPRPQAKFRDMVDNSCTPFIPLLYSKPNQLSPLPKVFNELQAPTSLNALIENSKKWSQSTDRCTHPYLYEIQKFEPTDLQLKLQNPIDPNEDATLTMVTTSVQLQELITVLSHVTEFAVDLEHHSYRSYQGFVCLMQISTRTNDYIIDTLELKHLMQEMNIVFTDPKIVKVFHGADWDICWLQRDFGIYVVNMFDTGQASRVLQLPKYSLAFLLNYCCNIKADKQYQLADWRIRPLSVDMIKYARDDTHYLLFIYDRMKNELIRRSNNNNNLLNSVIDRSRDVAMKTYHRHVYSEEDYYKLCNKFNRSLNRHQLCCLKLLYQWRDQLARQEDESIGYVLPNHMLFQISETLPREPQGILACCNPIPTLLRQHLNEVFSLIEQARTNTEQTTVPVYTVSKHLSNISDKKTSTKSDTSGVGFVNKYNTTINNISITNSTTIKRFNRVIPENIMLHLCNSEMKFRNILGMYLPVLETSCDDNQVISNIDTPVSVIPSPVQVPPVKKSAIKRPSTTLVDKHITKIKKPRKQETTDFTPFEYNTQPFTKAVEGKCSKTEEFYPKEGSSKIASQRSTIKMKSTKTITTKTRITRSNR